MSADGCLSPSVFVTNWQPVQAVISSPDDARTPHDLFMRKSAVIFGHKSKTTTTTTRGARVNNRRKGFFSAPVILPYVVIQYNQSYLDQ